MPKCYLVAIAGGSSLDRYSNNVTLFNMVEQLNFPKEQPPPPGAVLPLEIHAYFQLAPEEINQRFEVRFSLLSDTGLETLTDGFAHRSQTVRYRTRTVGLPAPPVAGSYELCVDVRAPGSEAWQRQSVRWPLVITETEPRPAVTH
ncbi:MAG TPA: hypothetical protein VFQ61_17935 [Polyangiaceae bacterium]|nr:hypothetical protein [Polyangiaceae bacterium]